MTVEFRLLGDIGACFDGRPVDVGYPRLRSVLAVLLIDADRTVSVDQLVDRVWGDQRLPARPRGALQRCMTVLRQALAGLPGVDIVWQAAGYRITTPPESVDVHRFRELIEHRRFTPAFELWRGEPFAGVHTPWFAILRSTLLEQHYLARLDFIDELLDRGRHTEVLAELADHIRSNPLDERLAGQYMLALYRNGRQAEALAHHQRVRQQLADHFGTDPTPPLQRLHEQILTADPALCCQHASSTTRHADSLASWRSGWRTVHDAAQQNRPERQAGRRGVHH